MSGGFAHMPEGGYERLAAELTELRNRVAELERPTGTQLINAVAEIRSLVADLQSRIDDLLASGIVTTSIHATGDSDLDGQLRSLGAAGTDVTLLPGPRSTLWIHDATGTIGHT